MTVVCGFTQTKSKVNYASVSSMTKPVFQSHVNASGKDKLKESSLDCHESMEVYKQGTKERDLHEDDLY